MNIPDDVKFIISVLNKNGFSSYAVGGCIRDMLMDRTPDDWDITTNALPEEIKACFIGFNVIETGIKHGTLTVIINKTPYEITTYRLDGEYHDNRRPSSVQFTDNINNDLSRRDFTVNSIAFNPQKGIIDIFGGENDIKNKLIRCVGNPNIRFNEDALRIMRALRFAAVLDFEIENETSNAIQKNKHLLKNISAERISAEFSKLIRGKNALKILDKYRFTIAEFIPEIIPMFDFKQNTPYHIYDVWKHTLHAVENADNEIKLTMFFHDISKPQCYTCDENGIGHFYGHEQISAETAKNILKRLKYDNNAIENIYDIIYFHDYDLSFDNKSIKNLLKKVGYKKFKLILKAKKADDSAKNPKFNRIELYNLIENELENIINSNECFSLKQLAVNGNTLISLGVKEGCIFKIILNDLLDKIIEGTLANNENDLKNYILNNYSDYIK